MPEISRKGRLDATKASGHFGSYPSELGEPSKDAEEAGIRAWAEPRLQFCPTDESGHEALELHGDARDPKTPDDQGC
ncbi:MAG: hypothetical protein Kow0010_26490 [Dehalococcoidia bacterium]